MTMISPFLKMYLTLSMKIELGPNVLTEEKLIDKSSSELSDHPLR